MPSQSQDPPAAVLHARRIGSGDGHHLFGYYNKTPWDRSGRYLLAQQVPMMNADLTPDLGAEIGYFDLHERERFHVLARTTAWNWQMGSQLQWLDGMPGSKVIFNVRTTDESATYPCLGAVVCDVETGEQRHLPLPVYVVAPNSTYALTVDYRRLHVTHPTIGYGDLREAAPLALAPDDDGIRRMDTSTGASELVVSYRALREIAPRPSMDGAIHWVSHIEVNPSSTRVVFLHRWTERIEDETCFLHRLITMNPDGTDLRILEDSDHLLPQLAGRFDPSAVGTYDYEKSEYQISHPLWRDDDHVIVWSPHAGRIHYHLYRDADDGAVEVIGGGRLVENGHMSFSPVDPRWLLSDTYPDPATHERILFVFDVATGRRHDLGSYYADPRLRKENRCDLHPRWSRDGREVCIDSVHESERQMYIVDVSSLTGGQQSAAAASTHLT